MDITAARLRAQCLTGPRPADVATVVRRLVGLQAQDRRANRLAVRVRTTDLTAADVDKAVAERSVVRTWAMRGTLHMLAAEDVGWIVRLLGPRFAARFAGRRRQLGLDEATLANAMAALPDVLTGATLTRANLVEQLAARGVEIDPTGQAPAHLVAYAAMTGVICRATEVGDEPTYALLDDWIATAEPPIGTDTATARLAQRYLTGYGPAGPEDFAAWTGLPVNQARTAFESIDNVATTVEPEHSVRLLGHFDAYLLGYRDRSHVVPPEHHGAKWDSSAFAIRQIQAGGGFVMPAIAVDGRIVGTWQQQHRAKRLDVVVRPFTTIPRRAVPGLRAEVADLGRFLGVETELA